MNYQEKSVPGNEQIRERYESAVARISDIPEEQFVPEQYQPFFNQTATRIHLLNDIVLLNQSRAFRLMEIRELKESNRRWYAEIISQYEESFANPTYAVKCLGERMGRMLSFLYSELLGLYAFSFENRLFDITILLELYLEIYYDMYNEDDPHKAVQSAIYYYIYDYMEESVSRRIQELLDPTLTFARDIILNEDLDDLRYLYYFGEAISENELLMATFLNRLPDEDIVQLAGTFTEGYRKGFENNGIDLSRKRTVQIRYILGMERLVKEAIFQFQKMGLETILIRHAVSKRQPIRYGYESFDHNRQFTYDHRFDDALFLSKGLIDRQLTCLRSAFESYKELAFTYAGPAVIEIFGERPFQPVSKPECLKYNKKQKMLSLDYRTQSGLITNEYIKRDAYSFTIIAFPIPQIGTDFEEIFKETVKVNTLDDKQYQKIQQLMIDEFDQGEYVRIKGNTEKLNHTDLKIMLAQLKNPEKETRFENCLADVNIPLGEVFTTPSLKGTEGILHVSEVHLNGLKYLDLRLTFHDGKITDYNCMNYKKEKENKHFIKENLLFQHDTLPIGEFAVGTNTTAYKMGRKYNISHMLPILIAEKTGPHFAIGDTCYSNSEDVKVYNPDGKEMVAKDNECSILRKTDRSKAYFNCHTDITIPYDELGEITIYHKDGKKITIIKDGRFVLKGTEALNQALEEIK